MKLDQLPETATMAVRTRTGHLVHLPDRKARVHALTFCGRQWVDINGADVSIDAVTCTACVRIHERRIAEAAVEVVVGDVAEGTTCEDHTHGPSGYSSWHDWAERMSKTHRQRQCAECDLWSIWEPKA